MGAWLRENIEGMQNVGGCMNRCLEAPGRFHLSLPVAPLVNIFSHLLVSRKL
jgi:hypothetical protein